MKIIAHRKNQIEDLRATPLKYGIEIDIRSQGGKLTIHHDPFVAGTDFEEWLKVFNHGTLILNVKEEGLETRLLKLMAARKIDDFFFLDQSFPFLLRTARAGEPRCAVRVSEFESIDTALKLSGLVKWVWVDCFTEFPLARVDADKLRRAGFKLCLVSPELQGRQAEESISDLRRELDDKAITPDAVCTKRPDLWEA